MSKTSAIIGLIALIAIGGFIIFGEDNKNKINVTETENTTLMDNSNKNIENEDSSLGKTLEQTSDVETSVEQTAIVTYNSSGFNPSVININKGDTVKFVNESSGSMWVASDPHPVHTDYSAFDAQKNYSNGESYSFTFTESGAYEYHNHVNPSMRGTVIVLDDK